MIFVILRNNFNGILGKNENKKKGRHFQKQNALALAGILFFEMPSSSTQKIMLCNGAFTLDVKLVLNENLSGILGGTQC